MKTFNEYLEAAQGNIAMEILFSEKDFEKFKEDYTSELYAEKITMQHNFDEKANKVRVVLHGDSSYLSNKYLVQDIEKTYHGAIA